MSCQNVFGKVPQKDACKKGASSLGFHVWISVVYRQYYNLSAKSRHITSGVTLPRHRPQVCTAGDLNPPTSNSSHYGLTYLEGVATNVVG